jgi:hypothetical protein
MSKLLKAEFDTFHRGITQGGKLLGAITQYGTAWSSAVGLVVLLLVAAPYALAHLSVPPDRTFSGSLLYLLDSNSYMATIRHSMAGNWTFYDLYTPEPHQPGPLHLFYVAWGKIGALLGLSPADAFTLARIVDDALLLVVLYWFLTIVLSRRSQRRTAFLFLAFSSGLGWMLLVFGGSTVLGDRAPDFWMAEANTFLTLLVFPHFAAATSLMLLAFGGLLLAFRQRRIVPALAAALAAFVLAWIHPFLLALVYAVIGTYLVWLWIRFRRVPWRAAGWFSLCVAVSLPVVAYLQFGVISPNAVFQAWMDQNAAPSPNVLALSVGFGLLLPLALIGAGQILRGRDGLDPFPLIWAIVGSLLLYAPFATQRRFSEGLHIPLCVLAAVGWSRAKTFLDRRRISRILLTSLLVVGLGTSNLLSWLSTMTHALNGEWPFFLSRYEVEAMRWLGEHSNWTDTVLSSYLSGSYLPVWAGNRVVIGHWAETIRLAEKEQEIEEFFGAATSPDTRQEIIQRNDIRYLYYGPNERGLGGYDPDADPSWEVVFVNDQVQVYRLKPG